MLEFYKEVLASAIEAGDELTILCAQRAIKAIEQGITLADVLEN